jgi:hypothetical protein
VVLAAGAGATGFALRHAFVSPQQAQRSTTQHASTGHSALPARAAAVAPITVVAVADAAIPQQAARRVARRAAPLASISISFPARPADRMAGVPVVPPRRVAPLDAAPGDGRREKLTAQAATAQVEVPARPAVLPISFGQPVAPETVRQDGRHAWHHRSEPVRHNEILPAPGWPAAQDNVVSQVATPFEVAQGDGDEAAPQAAASTYDVTSYTQGPEQDAAYVPVARPLRGVQEVADVAASEAPMVVPAVVTRLSVPQVSSAFDDAPAQRVDADVAAAVNAAPDDTARLAQLPPAEPAKLAVPNYPAVAADLQMPGRVRVGCVITVRGEPANCQVTHRVGTPSFATAVMQWLHSGEVRYRPHLVHGAPVPEAHAYDVRFVP